ncbi:hypothetical protein [Fictibacillus barbaricus]|uniref:Uncharacterized protein n=1 Tax=Fictibacillus barbaricus TaxID=182136 RepID=A0ABU1U5D7_9BACL|nr:hypothetical protein [Fictibacillus barbaricus]MDR7074673.1 hypothetical protein [Fictibacillus barbaricus]
MPEQGHKPPRISDKSVDDNPYLDTSKHHSTRADYDGGSPYLDTSENPTIQVNNAGGSPYLNTSDDSTTTG